MVNRNFIWRATLIAVFFILACGFLLTSIPVLAETTSTPTSTPQTPTSTPTYNCYDSDGGIDSFEKGTVDGWTGVGQHVTQTDSCIKEGVQGATPETIGFLHEMSCLDGGGNHC